MNQEQLDRQAFRFFKLFAHYESVLKERGYFQEGENRSVIVDWDRFANEVVGTDFAETLGESSEAAEYILQNPPKRQVVDENGLIIWQEVPNTERSAQILFSHISRMRNNLFHGAKFNNTWFDPRRSNALLERALIVLEHYRQWFDSGTDR